MDSPVEPPFVLALDVGSSSVRAMLVDARGRFVPGVAARERYGMETTPEGGAETDADALLDRLARVVDAALARAGVFGAQIAAVATATLAPSLVGVEAAGRALTPLHGWADTRATPDTVALRQRFDERAILDRTGCPLHPSYHPARLRWLRRTAPDLAGRVWRWLTFGEFASLRLFGEPRVSFSAASWTGLLDRRRLVWAAELLAALPIEPSQLSPLIDRDQPQTGLRPEYAARWPVLGRIPWFPAVGDGAAANVGSGCLGPSRVAVTIGTSGAIRAALVDPVEQVPWGLWCYRIDRRRSLLGGALSEGGNLRAWLGRLLQLGDPATLEQQLVAQEPDGHGLTVLPFVAGERSPGWAGDARAAIVGLSLTTRPIDVLRASLEAVAYRFALLHDLLRPTLTPGHELVASGGSLLASTAWRQMLADVLGRPLAVPGESEATSRGAAILALEALGLLPDLEAAPPVQVVEVRQPDPPRHARYRAAVDRQQRLYDVLVRAPWPDGGDRI